MVILLLALCYIFCELHCCKALLFLIVLGFGGLLLSLCNKGYCPTANTYYSMNNFTDSLLAEVRWRSGLVA